MPCGFVVRVPEQKVMAFSAVAIIKVLVHTSTSQVSCPFAEDSSRMLGESEH